MEFWPCSYSPTINHVYSQFPVGEDVSHVLVGSDVTLILQGQLDTTENMTLSGGNYNNALGQVANLFNKVILCVQGHAVIFVQVYTNPFIGECIMNIKKWDVRQKVNYKYCKFLHRWSLNVTIQSKIWLNYKYSEPLKG